MDNYYIISLEAYDSPIIEARDYKDAFFKLEKWVSNKPNEVFQKALSSMSSVEEMKELFCKFYGEDVNYICKLDELIKFDRTETLK